MLCLFLGVASSPTTSRNLQNGQVHPFPPFLYPFVACWCLLVLAREMECELLYLSVPSSKGCIRHFTTQNRPHLAVVCRKKAMFGANKLLGVNRFASLTSHRPTGKTCTTYLHHLDSYIRAASDGWKERERERDLLLKQKQQQQLSFKSKPAS